MKTFLASSVLIAVLVLMLMADPAAAQGGPNLPTAPEQTPIDGGLGLLAAAGGAYAFRRFRRSKA